MLGRYGAEMALPAAGKPGKIFDRAFASFGRDGDDSDMRCFSLRGVRVSMHGEDRTKNAVESLQVIDSTNRKVVQMAQFIEPTYTPGTRERLNFHRQL